MKKSHFNLACILGIALITSQLVPRSSVAAEKTVSLITSKEVQDYASSVAKKINNTASAILCIPTDQQTFDNVLRPWSQLSAQLSQDFNLIDAQGKLDSQSGITPSQALYDLQAYWIEVSQNPELQQNLMNSSLNTANDQELDPFQRYIGARFLQKGTNEPIHLPGSIEEKSSSESTFTVLNLKSGSLEQVSDLVNKVLTENADIVCIREVIADDHAYELYEILKDNYAHFVYVPPTSTLETLSNSCCSGMLIASKYQMEEAKFNKFQEKDCAVSEGFFDFIVKQQGNSLGHVYAANISKNAVDEKIASKFMHILEKMQDDALKVDESIPFVLCGDFNSLKEAQESELIIDEYIPGHENRVENKCARLLETLSTFSKFKTFLIKSRDSGGEFNVGVECKWGGKGGPEFSGYVRAEAHDDNGNYVEARATQNSRGEGSASVDGGYKPDRD